MNSAVTVKLVSADIPALLSALNTAGIGLYDVIPEDGLTVGVRVKQRCYPALMQIVQKRGDSAEILHRHGLYWHARSMIFRPVLILGILLILGLVIYLPTRVLFFQVEGNVTVPSRLILEKCEEAGVGFGASRRDIRSERVKNALLEAIPELQWVGVNTTGCVATISVRERSQADQPQQESCAVSSIVAARDGIIRELTVTRGTPSCTVGQAVTEGQVLISGYTDCGISIVATRAEGEIYAETYRSLEALTLSESLHRGEILRQSVDYSLVIGKFQINFSDDSGILDTSCVKMYSEYYLTLPGGFRLPVAIVKRTATVYDSAVRPVSGDALCRLLTEFSERYLNSRMTAGQILVRRETVDGAALYGQYACLEMIGQMRVEETLGNYGENYRQNG